MPRNGKRQTIAGAPTKIEAASLALLNEIAGGPNTTPLRERLAKAKGLAQSIGPGDHAFDMKAFTDSMWETSLWETDL